jgi:hypothetical protein
MKILCLDEKQVFKKIKSCCSKNTRTFFNADCVNTAIDCLMKQPEISLIISEIFISVSQESLVPVFSYLEKTHQAVPMIIFSETSERKVLKILKYHELITVIEKHDFAVLAECIDIYEEGSIVEQELPAAQPKP